MAIGQVVIWETKPFHFDMPVEPGHCCQIAGQD